MTTVASRKSRWPLAERVEVEFDDACSSGQWRTMADHRRDDGPSRCRSIGYLLERSSRCITLAQSQSRDTQNVADTMSIPRKAVIAIRRLR
jgi:hypothetical protein